MDPNSTRDTGTDAPRTQVLVVADWAIDPHGVVEACVRRMDDCASDFTLLVPAWLHGLDWAGDPKASAPCAQRQLASIRQLADARGLDYAVAVVGDADVVTAICDVLAASPAEEVLLCSRPSLLHSHPFDVAHRARRATGLPVRRIEVPAAAAARCSPRDVSSARVVALRG
jgi:hypothetical protein